MFILEPFFNIFRKLSLRKTEKNGSFSLCNQVGRNHLLHLTTAILSIIKRLFLNLKALA
jgi:hypothetical protein